MFVYTTPSYPRYRYSPPPVTPLSFHAHPIPTARERYLQAMVDARAAREQYILELEKQRLLAGLRHREALRQAEFRQRQISAAHNAMLRRRTGLACGEHGHSMGFPCQSRRQAFARHHRWVEAPMPSSQFLVDGMLVTLYDDPEGPDGMKDRETLADQRRKAVCGDRGYTPHKLEAILQEARNLHACRSSSESATPSKCEAGPTSTTSSASNHTDIENNHNARDRAARKIQRRWRSHSADAAAHKDAFQTISTLRARLQFLQDTFSFPEHLQFRESSSQQEAPSLLFVPANAAVHSYTHELIKLLTLADAVPSHGNNEVREARRTFVKLVEEVLDSIDRRVAKVWGKRVDDVAAAAPAADVISLPTASPTDAPQTTSGPEVDHLKPGATADEPRSVTPEVPFATAPSSPSNGHPLPVESHDVEFDLHQKLQLEGDAASDTPQQNDVILNPQPSLQEGSGTPPNSIDIDAPQEVVVHVQLTSISAEEATPEDLGPADTSPMDATPGSPFVPPSDVPILSNTAETEANAIDAITTPQEEDGLSSPGSTASDCVETFDVVYPDSLPPSSPNPATDDADLPHTTQDNSGSDESNGGGQLQNETALVVDEVQIKLEAETDGFELL